MATETETRHASRTPLSRERVLRGATDLADAGGPDALTMRKLAQELGVEAMSLYHYFASKDELLAGMVELVVQESDPVSDEGDWRTAVRRSSISFHKVLMRHPWAADLILRPGPISRARLRQMDGLLRRLRGAGFSPEMAHHAYHAIESHVMGFTLWLAAMALEARNLENLAAAFLRDVSLEEVPWFAEHVETHLAPSTEYTGTEFEFGLDLVLDGLERILDTG